MYRCPDHVRAATTPAVVRFAVAALFVISLGGCSPDTHVEPPVLRAVKVEVVRQAAAEGERLTGIVRQRQRAGLAFESPGRLISLDVDVGDRVRKGQVLAVIDSELARQRLRQAQASSESSRAQRVERESNYRRQQRLYAAGSVAQGIVEAARAEYAQAVSQQRSATADLELARREIGKGQLLAPFSGRVVERRADPFAQLTQGQVVLELESDTDRQVVAEVPAQQAQRLKRGGSAHAYLASQPSVPVDLQLEGVSPRATNGLTQTCIFRLLDPAALLPSGVAVLVQLTPERAEQLSIPVSSLSMGATESSAKVFVYQPAQGTVAVRNIVITNIEGGRAWIGGGLAAGESVVTAGAAFLSDGQAVDLYHPLTRLAQD
jgi:RND family efflux transporter MFP subunit